MPSLRRGWTLHEMVLSLVVLGIVVALTAHLSTGQLRFLRGVNDVAAVRGQVHEAGAIVESALWGVAPAAGDVVAATDSALDILVGAGVAVACDSGTGEVSIPVPADSANTLSAFDIPLDAFEPVMVFLADTGVGSWTRATLASPPTASACMLGQSVVAAWRLRLLEPLSIPPGSVLRFTRRVRFSLYRASDGRWYLGARDWNAGTGQLNTIQPVAGPLEPYNANPIRSGLGFRYFDADAVELTPPVDVGRIARIDLSARAATRRPVRASGMATTSAGAYVDSLIRTVGLRNRP